MKPKPEPRFNSPFLHTGDLCLPLTISFIGDPTFRVLFPNPFNLFFTFAVLLYGGIG
jgi:hypothetical protein